MLVQQMAGLARKLNRVASELGPEVLKGAAETGELLKKAMAPWQAGIAAVEALADYTYVRIGPAANLLLAQMLGLARKLGYAHQSLDRALSK